MCEIVFHYFERKFFNYSDENSTLQKRNYLPLKGLKGYFTGAGLLSANPSVGKFK